MIIENIRICETFSLKLYYFGVVVLNKIYVVRHSEAEGQSPDSQLTERDFKQARELADFFYEVKVDRIISSPIELEILNEW